MTFLPDRLEDWISAFNLVRIADLFVDKLHLADLGCARATAARAGTPVTQKTNAGPPAKDVRFFSLISSEPQAISSRW
ncbi:hypothetical protein [Salinihabitans flavidus]|nr:hypothetical protein [Salinihabitans flavidus]